MLRSKKTVFLMVALAVAAGIFVVYLGNSGVVASRLTVGDAEVEASPMRTAQQIDLSSLERPVPSDTIFKVFLEFSSDRLDTAPVLFREIQLDSFTQFGNVFAAEINTRQMDRMRHLDYVQITPASPVTTCAPVDDSSSPTDKAVEKKNP